jgi:hypothetical protein
LYILTKPGKALDVPLTRANPQSGTPGVATTYYPASFRHPAAPTRPVVGIVRDKDTSKPLAGVTVQCYQLANYPLFGIDIIRTRTDEQARYRLTGLPKGKGNKIMVIPADDQPYLVAAAEVPDPPSLDPVTVRFELKRGIWIEGRLTDKATGKPAQGDIYYLARIGNKAVGDHVGYEPIPDLPASNVQKDRMFRVVGLPGPGLLAVVCPGDHYLLARERDDEEGTNDLATPTSPVRVATDGYCALAQIDPPKGVESFRRDVTLDPGQTLTGMILGPDGKPLAGVRTYRLTPYGDWNHVPLETGSFTVQGFNLRKPRLVLFLHPGKRLVGALESPESKADKVSVRMTAGAAVTGRLVDGDGQPRANVELFLGIRDPSRDMWVRYFPDRIKSDADGRIRIETLVPGGRFILYDGRGGEWHFGVGFRAGETKDLGDVQLKGARQ